MDEIESFDNLLTDITPVKTINNEIQENFNNEESPWLWNGKPIESIDIKKFKCFVYLITNKQNKKRYIGFKTTISRKIKVIKGKKHHIEVESDWRTYWSSSENIQEDVRKMGKGNFIREILYLCPMKGVGKYIELQEQIDRRVLTENNDKYYNGIINLRIGANAIKKFSLAEKCEFTLGDRMNL